MRLNFLKRSKTKITNSNLVIKLANSWCYFWQYAEHGKSLSGKVDYFVKCERRRVPRQYRTEMPLTKTLTDALIFAGISKGSIMDFGENNKIQTYLKTEYAFTGATS